MATRMERRLLWHPRHENAFILGGGSQLTLYEWDPEVPEFKHITSQTDFQLMKCFAWSPHPTFRDLVAVGMSTGKVDLIRLEATKYARNNIVSSGPVLSLNVRSSRSCAALTFCSNSPNLLAVGLDKVRAEPSLIVWDVEAASTVLSLPGIMMKPEIDLKGVQSNVLPHTHQIQSYALQDVVSSIAFLPQSSNLLIAGISGRWLRTFDLRNSRSVYTNSVASKVHSIAIDPLDQHRVACIGDGIVTVWDVRKHLQPLLSFTEKDASADGSRYHRNDVFTGVEFSSVRRGLLATLDKDANHVRFWDVQQAQIVEQLQSSEEVIRSETPRDLSQASKFPRLMLPWSAAADSQPQLNGESSRCNVVLANTSRTKSFNRTLVSFVLVPSTSAHPLTFDVLVVNKEGDFEMHTVHDVPKHSTWSARGELGIGAGVSYRIISGLRDIERPLEPWEIIPTSTLQDVSRTGHSLDRRGRGLPESIQPRLDAHDRPGFGRGDQDGFPALSSSHRESSLTATRPLKNRTYSPASIGRYHMGQTRTQDATNTDFNTSDPGQREVSTKVSTKAHTTRRSISRGGKRSAVRAVSRLLIEDISMTMRERVIQGYGPANPLHNANISQYEHSDALTLTDIWLWFDHSRKLLSRGTSKVHGFDFAYQGVMGIWEGLNAPPHRETAGNSDDTDSPSASEPSSLSSLDANVNVDMNSSIRARHAHHRSQSPADTFYGNYHAAVTTLNSRRDPDKSSWKSQVPTTKLPQRKLALALCDWKAGEEELQQWEKAGKYSQAACWLLCTNQQPKAIELLMRSQDETHQMMSGALAALILQHGTGSSSRSPELREHCERLIIKLQDPYFRVMLSYVVLGDWSDILEEEALPLRERLSMAFRFLEDKPLTSYLRRITDSCRSKGFIEGLILTGLTPRGLDILQSYVDRTGDIQTAATLSCYVCPNKYKDPRTETWLEAYRGLLDGWKLFHHRCQFDIDRGDILREAIQAGDTAPFEWVPRQFLIRCTYCNKVVNSQSPREATSTQRKRAAACPACGRGLPRCSICLMGVSIVADSDRRNDLLQSSFRDTIDDAFIFCQTCRHGGHASHIIDWFYGENGDKPRKTCPVADCVCLCDEGF